MSLNRHLPILPKSSKRKQSLHFFKLIRWWLLHLTSQRPNLKCWLTLTDNCFKIWLQIMNDLMRSWKPTPSCNKISLTFKILLMMWKSKEWATLIQKILTTHINKKTYLFLIKLLLSHCPLLKGVQNTLQMIFCRLARNKITTLNWTSKTISWIKARKDSHFNLMLLAILRISNLIRIYRQMLI